MPRQSSFSSAAIQGPLTLCPPPLQSKEGRMFSPVLNFSRMPERVVEFGMCLHACWGKSPEATVHVIFQVSPPFSAICLSSFHSVLPRSHVSSQAMREDAFRVTRADGVSACAVRQLQAVSENAGVSCRRHHSEIQ